MATRTSMAAVGGGMYGRPKRLCRDGRKSFVREFAGDVALMPREAVKFVRDMPEINALKHGSVESCVFFGLGIRDKVLAGAAIAACTGFFSMLALLVY